VGNSDVPYPYAVGEKFMYLMIKLTATLTNIGIFKIIQKLRPVTTKESDYLELLNLNALHGKFVISAI
jgi:hypothetical protein